MRSSVCAQGKGLCGAFVPGLPVEAEYASVPVAEADQHLAIPGIQM